MRGNRQLPINEEVKMKRIVLTALKLLASLVVDCDISRRLCSLSLRSLGGEALFSFVTGILWAFGKAKKAFFVAAAFALLYALLLGSCAAKLGDIVEKEVTVNGEKQVRKLMYQSLTEYDWNGKPIHYNFKKQYETWREYDTDGNEIHYKTSRCKEEWYEYDGRGNKIHERDNKGVEWRAEYDERGNEIRCVMSDGREILNEYDEMGKKVCIKVLIGGKVTEEYRNKYDYDEKGNCIHSVEPIENMEKWMEYDSAGHPVHVYDRRGWQVWHEYNADGNEIYYKSQCEDTVHEEWRIEYDAAGRKNRQKDTDGTEYLWEYDAGGNCVYENQGGGTEIFYEYDFHPNGKIKAERAYTSAL